MSLSSEQFSICEKGNLEDILSIVNQGCNKNKILTWSSQFGHLEVVKYLIEKCGADVRANNDEAVRYASGNGHVEVVKYLVEKCGAILLKTNPQS